MPSPRPLLCAMLFVAFMAAPTSAQPPARPQGSDADRSSIFEFSDVSGLPAYLKVDGKMLADARGLHGGEARTIDADYLEKDFVLVVAFEMRAADQPNLQIGIGGFWGQRFRCGSIPGGPNKFAGRSCRASSKAPSSSRSCRAAIW